MVVPIHRPWMTAAQSDICEACGFPVVSMYKSSHSQVGTRARAHIQGRAALCAVLFIEIVVPRWMRKGQRHADEEGRRSARFGLLILDPRSQAVRKRRARQGQRRHAGVDLVIERNDCALDERRPTTSAIWFGMAASMACGSRATRGGSREHRLPEGPLSTVRGVVF